MGTVPHGIPRVRSLHLYLLRRRAAALDDLARVRLAALLDVLLVKVADAAAKSLRNGATAGLLDARLRAVPNNLDPAAAAAREEASKPLSEWHVLELRVELSNGARRAALVQAASLPILDLEEALVPVALGESVKPSSPIAPNIHRRKRDYNNLSPDVALP